MSKPAVLAAGAVLWRWSGAADPRAGNHRVENSAARSSADLEVALVHRPGYGDWTLPKGKLERGERSLLAAVREVGEETGASVQVGRRLISVEYSLASARGSDADRKIVSYWSMRYVAGEHTPSAEVDRIVWCTVPDAINQLSYDTDRSVLHDFAAHPTATSTLLLIRHAKAGKRSDFKGDDRLRPLVKIGRRQARDCAPFLAAFCPDAIISAAPLRCAQTVEPLAAMLNLPIVTQHSFSDEAYAQDPDGILKTTLDLLQPGSTTVVASQGGTIPGLIRSLGHRQPVDVRKGSLWVLSFQDTTLLAADYYSKPQV